MGYQSFVAECSNWVGCISHHEAAAMLRFRSTDPLGQMEGSIDLSMTTRPIYFLPEGVTVSPLRLPETMLATWDELTAIAERKVGCHALYDDGSKPWQVKTISPNTNIPASLCPPLQRPGAPTMLLGGFTMHRISGDNVDPIIDTNNKMSAVKIYPGARVLDTCMGLGYTAISAARLLKGRGSVTTCECDMASLEMSAYNPWSRPLHDNSLPISIMQGDATELVGSTFADGELDVVIHDPPAKALCRMDLYGTNFYSLLHRKLRKSGGQLFHYIGNPDSRESGRLFRGVMERLSSVGFKNVRKFPSAFGVVAST